MFGMHAQNLARSCPSRIERLPYDRQPFFKFFESSFSSSLISCLLCRLAGIRSSCRQLRATPNTFRCRSSACRHPLCL